MLNGAVSRPKTNISVRLMIPTLGLINSTQDIDSSMPGMATGAITNAYARLRNGVLVRSMSQAKITATGRARRTDPVANTKVL